MSDHNYRIKRMEFQTSIAKNKRLRLPVRTFLLIVIVLASLPGSQIVQVAGTLKDNNLPEPVCGLNTDVFFLVSTDGQWAFSTGGVGDSQYLWTDPDQTPLPDLRLGDFDGVVMLNATAAGASAPVFEAPTDFFGGAEVRSLVAGDFSLDGQPDVAAAQLAANNLGLLSNQTQPVGLIKQEGSNQSVRIGKPFSTPLTIRASDACGNRLSGAKVTFTTPDSGPSAELSEAITVTGSSGLASGDAVANKLAGSYMVIAALTGTATQLEFDLSNIGEALYLPLHRASPRP